MPSLATSSEDGDEDQNAKPPKNGNSELKNSLKYQKVGNELSESDLPPLEDDEEDKDEDDSSSESLETSNLSQDSNSLNGPTPSQPLHSEDKNTLQEKEIKQNKSVTNRRNSSLDKQSKERKLKKTKPKISIINGKRQKEVKKSDRKKEEKQVKKKTKQHSNKSKRGQKR